MCLLVSALWNGEKKNLVVSEAVSRSFFGESQEGKMVVTPIKMARKKRPSMTHNTPKESDLKIGWDNTNITIAVLKRLTNGRERPGLYLLLTKEMLCQLSYRGIH